MLGNLITNAHGRLKGIRGCLTARSLLNSDDAKTPFLENRFREPDRGLKRLQFVDILHFCFDESSVNLFAFTKCLLLKELYCSVHDGAPSRKAFPGHSPEHLTLSCNFVSPMSSVKRSGKQTLFKCCCELALPCFGEPKFQVFLDSLPWLCKEAESGLTGDQAA